MVPFGERQRVLELFHDSPMAGHLGRDKTLDKFQERFFWPRSYTEVVTHIKSCEMCQKAKSTPDNIQPLNPIKTSAPFDLLTMDIIGPILPASRRGNKYVIAMSDHNSKLLELGAMPTQTAKEVA